MTPALERAKHEAKSAREKAARAKSDPILLYGREVRRKEDNASPKVKVVEGKNDRPQIKFVDIGGKFIEVEDRRRRIHESQRRKEARK